MFKNFFLCISPLKINPKADRLQACAVSANFHYVISVRRLLYTVIYIINSKFITFIIHQVCYKTDWFEFGAFLL